MSEQKPQGEETPVIVAEQGQPKADVIAPQTPAKAETTPIPNAEWQLMQENLRMLNQKLSEKEIEDFESANPIVKTEKYKTRWEEMKQQKKDPHGKYSKLSWDELRKLMVEPEPLPKLAPQPVTMPSLNPSVGPDKPAGKIDPQARQWLEMVYEKDLIDAAEAA